MRSRFFSPPLFSVRPVSSRWLWCLLGLVASVIAWPAPSGAAQKEAAAEEKEDPQEPPLVGLRRIFGDEIPDDIDPERLDLLPESWKPWGEGLQQQIQDLYFEESLDLKGQRELIAALREHVATMNRAIRDAKFALIRDQLISFAGPLERRLDLAEAVLETLAAGPKTTSSTAWNDSQLELQAAAKQLDALLARQQGGGAWQSYFQTAELLNTLNNQAKPPNDLNDLLQKIAERFEAVDDLSGAQQQLLHTNGFFQVRRAIAQSLTAWELQEAPATEEQLKEALAEFVEALEASEGENLVADAVRLLLAADRLRLVAADASSLSELLSTKYFNDNLHSSVSEDVMREIVQEKRTVSGEISDTILGARVYGSQVTNTEATFDLLPSPNTALLVLRLAGETNANTVGVRGHVKVFSTGLTNFWAMKPARFDGFRFETGPADISVQAAANPYDAETCISCFPLLGTCLDRIILNVAQNRRGEGEAIARQKVAERVLPELNREINKSLDEANAELSNNVYRRLSNTGLYPSTLHVSSTETQLLARSLIHNTVELGGDQVSTVFEEPTGVNGHVHESLLNNFADRINLAGRTMTEDEVRAEMGRFLTELTGQVVDLSAPPKAAEDQKTDETEATEDKEKPATDEPQDRFVFDKTDPIRFQVRNGEVQLTIRTGLIRSNGDEIPPFDVTVPLVFELSGDQILIKKKTPLSTVAVTGRGFRAFAQGKVMGKKIEDSIPDGSQTRFITLRPQEGKELKLRIERIKALDGWVSLWAMPVDAGSQTAPPEPTPPAPAP